MWWCVEEGLGVSCALPKQTGVQLAKVSKFAELDFRACVHHIQACVETSDKRLKESAINRENLQDVVMAEIHICLWLMTKY